MIIIALKGGLGNQLFQYACGRSLAIKNDSDLKLDVSEYSDNHSVHVKRYYSLMYYNIKAGIATENEISGLKYPFGIISKLITLFRTKIRREFYIGFNHTILNNGDNTYLNGFFQTERYFNGFEDEIRKDLSLLKPLMSEASRMASTINDNKHSVSLHVRRGDYISDPVSSQYNGTCGAEYYSKALGYITSKIGNVAHLFIFSDDIDWVRKNMPLPYPTTYVSSPEIKDYEELHLMSLCSHHIIANSSFSWWGAWLDPKNDKIIIAPKRWTLKDNKNYKDICPPSWVRL